MNISLQTRAGVAFIVATSSIREMARLSLEEALSVARRGGQAMAKLTLEKAAIVDYALEATALRGQFKAAGIKGRHAVLDVATCQRALSLLGRR